MALDEKEWLDLVERAIQGDKEALAKVCEEKAKDVLYVTGYLIHDPQDREDAAQDIMLYMQEHIRDLKSPQAFHAWMYRIIKGICSNMKRNNSRRIYFNQTRVKESQNRNEFLPQEFLEDEEKKTLVLQIVKTLPERSRMCVLMFYYQGMSYSEVATALEISPKDVDNALVKARRIIRRKLEKDPAMKNKLRNIRGVAPVPVLSQVLKTAMEEQVTEEAAQQLLAGADGAAAYHNGDVVVKWGDEPGRRFPGKQIGIGVAVTAGVIAAIGMLLSRVDEEPEASPVTVQGSESEVQTVPDMAEDTLIRTLEDMIGVTEAEILRNYTEQEAVDGEGLTVFLEDIQMELWESLWDPVLEERDTLYILKKQDKRLLIMIREGGSEPGIGVVFRFSDEAEYMPEDIEIDIYYEQLKQSREME